MKPERYKTLTPLRAVTRYAKLADSGISADYRLREAQEALLEHVKAALTKRRGRRRP